MAKPRSVPAPDGIPGVAVTAGVAPLREGLGIEDREEPASAIPLNERNEGVLQFPGFSFRCRLRVPGQGLPRSAVINSDWALLAIRCRKALGATAKNRLKSR